MASPVTDSPLRVGFLIDRWNPQRGGAEQALCAFAAWLERRGYEVFAFGLEGPPQSVAAPGTFVPVRARGLTRSVRERRLAHAMTTAAAAAGCKLTVGVRHLSEVDLYWPHGGAHLATLRSLGKRASGRHRTFLELERAALEGAGARCVVCVSEMVRQEFLSAYPKSAARLTLIPNGVDTAHFKLEARPDARRELRTMAGALENEPVLTFVGRNAKLKGLPLLLEALSLLQDRPWRLVVAGPKDAAHWSRIASKSIAGSNRIQIASHLDSLLLAAGSDLLILPSRRDPCGLVVLEALACGTPVLISSAVGAKELINDPEQGTVFGQNTGAPELARLIAIQLDRIESGECDHGRVAATLLGRDKESWMSSMEQQLLDLAGTQRVT
ncbi:MAG: UDP-glucose:(heptosyl)LPS alpha-1,3-glucosyltransferase [Planctomycetota bacterium]|jgi:UDP-glucose:(heptosyl)LPS alpha-1,3-glucosyltransferase